MTVRDRKQVYHFDESMPARELLRRLQLLPNTVLVVRNGEVVTEDETLDAAADVRIVRVISGGRKG